MITAAFSRLFDGNQTPDAVHGELKHYIVKF